MVSGQGLKTIDVISNVTCAGPAWQCVRGRGLGRAGGRLLVGYSARAGEEKKEREGGLGGLGEAGFVSIFFD